MIHDAPRRGKWHSWGENALLALGMLCFYSLASMLTHVTVGGAVSNRVFSDRVGDFPWSGFTLRMLTGLVPSALAAAITGYVAGMYLRFSKAGWVVVLLGVLCALTSFGGQWFRAPAAWERGLEIAEPILIGLLLPAVFWLKRRFETATPQPGA